jgi:hypothetical protein
VRKLHIGGDVFLQDVPELLDLITRSVVSGRDGHRFRPETVVQLLDGAVKANSVPRLTLFGGDTRGSGLLDWLVARSSIVFVSLEPGDVSRVGSRTQRDEYGTVRTRIAGPSGDFLVDGQTVRDAVAAIRKHVDRASKKDRRRRAIRELDALLSFAPANVFGLPPFRVWSLVLQAEPLAP